MQRSRHNIEKMNTFTPCHFNDIIISVNAQVITYHETVKTVPSASPPFDELFHNIAEELNREISLFTLKEYSLWLTSYASFLIRLVRRRKSPPSNIRTSSENKNTKGGTTVRH